MALNQKWKVGQACLTCPESARFKSCEMRVFLGAFGKEAG